jgi:hypothetical protein
MVRFHSRRIGKHYKRGMDYSTKCYYNYYPVELNKDLEPIEDLTFEVEEFKRSRKDKRERVHVTFGRDLTEEEAKEQQPK